MASTYTEDHLVEQPAIQLMQHELGWDVMNCCGEPSSLAMLRCGYEWQELRRSGWEVPGKAEMLKRRKAIDGAVEENREIAKLRGQNSWVLFALEPVRQCNLLIMNEFLFEWKTSMEVSPPGETERLSEIPARKPMKSSFSRYRENVYFVKIGLSFTKISLFTAT